MDEPHLSDELKGLHQILKRLESGGTTIMRESVDVTHHEIRILKGEIARLESVLARAKAGSGNA